MNVTIANWEKYNPRKDIKHPSWFSLPNRILEDPDLFDLEPIEFKALIYLISQASQKNTPEITVNFRHAERVCLIREKDMVRAVQKLSDIGSVQICSGDERTRTESERVRTDDERARDATDTTDRQDKQTRPVFDFESIYAIYPRKEGKANGMLRLQRRIRSQDDFDRFAKAARKYASECKLSGKDLKYTMQWSTFVGGDGNERWLDYVDTKPPPAAVSAQAPPPAPEEPPLSQEQLDELKKRREILAGRRQPV